MNITVWRGLNLVTQDELLKMLKTKVVLAPKGLLECKPRRIQSMRRTMRIGVALAFACEDNPREVEKQTYSVLLRASVAVNTLPEVDVTKELLQSKVPVLTDRIVWMKTSTDDAFSYRKRVLIDLMER